MTAACKACLSNYDKQRTLLPHRVAARNNYQKTEQGKNRANEAKIKYIERNPVKRAAHNKVWAALRSGRLIRSNCEVCNALENIHAHHDDYSQPLVVRWLCTMHHNKWHKENGEGKNSDTSYIPFEPVIQKSA